MCEKASASGISEHVACPNSEDNHGTYESLLDGASVARSVAARRSPLSRPSCRKEMADGGVAALVARTKQAHAKAAAAFTAKRALEAPGGGGSEANKRPRPPLSVVRAAAPRFAERDMFMSSSASSVHAKAPERVKRPVVEDEDPLDMMAFSRKVERLGASQLTGLSKKDQDARTRVQLGLRQAKAQKMPYKRLLAVRKRMRAQDDASDALAKEAGMTARRKPVAGAGRFVTQAGGKGRGKGSGGAPSLGRSLSNGVLHVSQGDIKSARFAARKASKGGGKGGGKGGRGKGGGGKGGGGKGGGGKGKG